MVNVPNAISVLRILLVPLLLALAWMGERSFFFAMLVVSMLTDALDGWLARKLKQATELGARLDSWADLLTTFSLPFAVWWLRPDVVRAEGGFIILGGSFYVAAVVTGYLKFHKLTSYHTWGAKTGAVLFAIAVLVLFGGGPGWPIRTVMVFVAVVCAEEMLITATLSEWRSNVPTLWHAREIQARSKTGAKGSPL